jgi:Tfp pilus assembly protein PilN
MRDMDLIPGDFRQGLNLQRQLRGFLLACMLVLGGIAVARLGLGYATWRERAVVVSIEQQQQQLEQTHARTEELQHQRQVTEQQLATLEKLRGRDRVALFLHAVDQAYNAHIWLDSVHFLRRGGSADTQELAVTQGADLYGHATNHSELAQFMRLLGAQSAVADLRLISTNTRSYNDTQVIDFNLSLQVDDKVPVQP